MITASELLIRNTSIGLSFFLNLEMISPIPRMRIPVFPIIKRAIA